MQKASGLALEPDVFAELAEFVAIPSVSADPSHAGDVRAAGNWICSFSSLAARLKNATTTRSGGPKA